MCALGRGFGGSNRYDFRVINRLYHHFSKQAPLYLWVVVLVVLAGRYLALSINLSDSLTGKLYIVQKGTKPSLGDFAAFRYQGGGPYDQGVWFLKRVKGVAGSVVNANELRTGFIDYYVNGEYVGRAKPRSKSGIPLAAGPTGTIPSRHYYMEAPNPDSLDSRYALVGWVSDEQIVGRAYEVF